jgi:hypothetical protein
MWVLIVTIILALVAAVGLLGLIVSDEKGFSALFLAIGLILGSIVWVAGTYNRVETKHIGIETVYGKPTGKTYGAGLHWLAPWKTIEEWDATRQSYDLLGAKCEKPGDGSIWVSIAGQRQACIRVQINWETTSTAQAAKNWSTYKPGKNDGDDHFPAFTSREVDPAFNDAILATFKDYDPLALVDPKTGESHSPDLAGTYTSKLTEAINARLGDRTVNGVHQDADIKVMSLNWGLIGYDAPTTGQISAYAQKVLEGRNLSVDASNAAKRSAIAKQSGITSGAQACLDLIKQMGKGEPGLCVGAQATLTRSVG